jgi:aminoglycoside phosphotransferase (APT) family kinase protein
VTIGDKPAADVVVDAALVRGLLTDQHPDLAGLELVEHASGWDNITFRLGPALSVRIPRREMSAALVEHEQQWLPVLAPRLPLPVPAPVRLGRPGRGYPWSWSVCPWLPGVPAMQQMPEDAADTAELLGAFLAALHVAAPSDAPENPYRGGPLADRDVHMRNRIEQLGDLVDGDAVLARWNESIATPYWPGAPQWLHGDMHPGNVLVDHGRVVAVIDFGDMTAGDPASDLALAWMFFATEARARFRAAVGGVDDDTWKRARGWALAYAVIFIANSADDPAMARIGRATLSETLGDEA